MPEWPHKASAFIVFPDVRAACQASSILRDETGVDAVELFDRCGTAAAAELLLRLQFACCRREVQLNGCPRCSARLQLALHFTWQCAAGICIGPGLIGTQQACRAW